MSDFAVERARRIFQARQMGQSGQRQAPARAPRRPGGAAPAASAAPPEDAEPRELIGALYLLHSRLRQLDGWLRQEHRLNLTEMRVLSSIPTAPPALRPVGRGNAAARLAKELELSPSGLTRLVDRLVDRGLLTRVSDDWDRRVTHLVLTEQGRTVRDAILPRVADRLRDTCGGALQDELRVISTTLTTRRSAQRSARGGDGGRERV